MFDNLIKGVFSDRSETGSPEQPEDADSTQLKDCTIDLGQKIDDGVPPFSEDTSFLVDDGIETLRQSLPIVTSRKDSSSDSYHPDEQSQSQPQLSVKYIASVKRNSPAGYGGRGYRANGKFYTTSEDKKIVRYVTENMHGYSLRGNEFWKRMEADQAVSGRSWQSLKNRFKTVTVKRLDCFKILSFQRKQLEKEVGQWMEVKKKKEVSHKKVRGKISSYMVKEKGRNKDETATSVSSQTSSDEKFQVYVGSNDADVREKYTHSKDSWFQLLPWKATMIDMKPFEKSLSGYSVKVVFLNQRYGPFGE